MNWADITIISIIAISVVISLFRGFVREVLSLVAWVAAFWVAAQFAVQAGALLEPYLTIHSARVVLGFVGVLVLTLLAAGLINHLIGKIIEGTGLSATDRTLGALFGVVRGAAIVVIGVLAAGLTTVTAEPWWQQSRTIAPFETAALIIVDWLPPDLAKNFSF